MTDEKAVFVEVLRDKKGSVYSQRKKTGWGNRHGKAFAQPEESEASLRKKNGEVMEYKIGQKISWEEFKSYPPEMQDKYINWFVENFGVSSGMFGKVVDRSIPVINKWLNDCRPDLKGVFRKMPKTENQVKLDAWLKGENDEKTVVETKPTEPVVVEKIVTVEKPEMPYFVQTLQSGSMELCGTATEIFQTLYGIFRDAQLVLSMSFQVMPNEVDQPAEMLDQGQVNVNTCTFSELRSVGVAPNIAAAVVKHRPFATVEAIRDVPEIPAIAYAFLEKRVRV